LPPAAARTGPPKARTRRCINRAKRTTRRGQHCDDGRQGTRPLRVGCPGIAGADGRPANRRELEPVGDDLRQLRDVRLDGSKVASCTIPDSRCRRGASASGWRCCRERWGRRGSQRCGECPPRGRNWVAVRRPDGRQRSHHRAADQRVWWRAARDSNPNRQIRRLVLSVYAVTFGAVGAAQVRGRVQPAPDIPSGDAWWTATGTTVTLSSAQPITRRMLGVELDGTGRVRPAQVG
jgi:hypothetical protein